MGLLGTQTVHWFMHAQKDARPDIQDRRFSSSLEMSVAVSFSCLQQLENNQEIGILGPNFTTLITERMKKKTFPFLNVRFTDLPHLLS